MGIHHLSNVSLIGISASVPKRRFKVDEYEYFSDQEKHDFKKQVGIVEKRDSRGHYTASDLCHIAAEKLISNLNWYRNEIELIVLVTQTPDYILPASSVILQNRLGLDENTLAFDINLGCSGWIYGLAVIGSLMNSLGLKKSILLCGETSMITRYDDNRAFPLMGDAGTATALELKNGAEEIIFDLNSSGKGYDAIIAPESGMRFFTLKQSKKKYNLFATMQPHKILEFAARKVVPSIINFLSSSSYKIQDFDYFIFHQAGRIINEALRKKIGIPSDKFPYSLANFGNTSSASIPLTIITAVPGERLNNSLRFFCSGFGVGLSWGNAIISTSGLNCPSLVEVE